MLPSKRENGYRCFMLVYPRDDLYALIAINVLLSYAQNKRLGSKGLTLLFVGYDPAYSRFQYSLQLFLRKLNSGRTNAGLALDCSFTRDGVALASEDKFNMLFGAIFKKIKGQIPEDLREPIKSAHLETNEALFRRFSEWKHPFGQGESESDLGLPFESKSFENKQTYNRVVGDLLKLYISQGALTSGFKSNRVQSLRN